MRELLYCVIVTFSVVIPIRHNVGGMFRLRSVDKESSVSVLFP